MLNKYSKIYIAGHNGMVGSACWRMLFNSGYKNLIGMSSKDLDLKNQAEVKDFIFQEKPDAVINAAAKVGGILANDSYPYEFLMDNLLIQNNLIGISHEFNVNKFIFLGSSCIYPKFASQPISEDYLLTGSLESSNQWYAIAKISGVKLIDALRKQYGRDYVSLMPTNLYGPGDNFDLKTSHVLPAMIRKFHEATVNKRPAVTLWGTGNPKREFLHVDDLAKAVLFALENRLSKNLYNVGTGTDISIKNLAELVKKITKYQGEISWDYTKPDGTPRKLLNVTRLKKEGWKYNTELSLGINSTYEWFLNNINNLRKLSF